MNGAQLQMQDVRTDSEQRNLSKCLERHSYDLQTWLTSKRTTSSGLVLDTLEGSIKLWEQVLRLDIHRGRLLERLMIMY